MCDSKADYLTRVVRAFAAAFLPKEFWLSGREVECFVCIMLCLSDGHTNIFNDGSGDKGKSKNIEKYFSSFKDKKTLQVWLPKLVDKGWIMDGGDGSVKILQEFVPILSNKNTSFVLDFIEKVKEVVENGGD